MSNWRKSWDERFGNQEFAYGKEPNSFFKEIIDRLNLKGKMLFPAEGEGRNAVYGAKKGLEVVAFDISLAGKEKALLLAKENKVEINYLVGELPDLGFKEESFEAAAFLFSHFPPHLKSDYYTRIGKLIKSGGVVIIEVFSKKHLALRKENPEVGGPPKIELLYDKEEIKSYFPGFETIELSEKVVELQEGNGHRGKGSVIRFIGMKC